MPAPLPRRLKQTRSYRFVHDRIYEPLRFHCTRLATRGVVDLSFAGMDARFRFRTPIELERIRELTGSAQAETEFLESYLGACRAANTICDVGANIGIFSVLAALQDRNGAVHAFEPHVGNAQALRENIAANGLRNVEVHAIAVGEKPSTERLSSASHERGVGTHRIGDPASNGVEVAVDSIDHLVDSGAIAPPDVLKIDVEGYELHVLRGMQQTARRKPPKIFLELHEAILGPDARQKLQAVSAGCGLEILKEFTNPGHRTETHLLLGRRSV